MYRPRTPHGQSSTPVIYFGVLNRLDIDVMHHAMIALLPAETNTLLAHKTDHFPTQANQDSIPNPRWCLQPRACRFLILGYATGITLMTLRSWRPGSLHVGISAGMPVASDDPSTHFSRATLSACSHPQSLGAWTSNDHRL